MSPLRCFYQTLKACVTNLSCAPFFLLAVLFYSLYYCWPYQAQLPEHINAAIVDEDNSQLSLAVSRALLASPDFKIIRVCNDRPEAIEMMKSGQISSIIGIPAQFESNAVNGIPTALTLVTNGAFIVIARAQSLGAAGVLEKIANAAIAGHLYEAGAPLAQLAKTDQAPPIVVQAMYNTISGYLSFAVAIVFVIIFQTIMVCGMAMLFNDWFARNPYPAPLACSFGRPVWLFALQAPVICLCIAWILFIEGFAFAWHGINSFQNIPATLLTSLFFSWAVTALGLMIVMLFKTSNFALYMMVMSSLPCVFISGNLFPWQNIPIGLRLFAWFLPSTPGVDAMLRASQAGATCQEIFPYLMHLLLLGCLYFFIAWLVSRKYRNDPQTKNALTSQGIAKQV